MKRRNYGSLNILHQVKRFLSPFNPFKGLTVAREFVHECISAAEMAAAVRLNGTIVSKMTVCREHDDVDM